MEKHILEEEDFKEIFKDIISFKNIKNSILEIGYLYYGSFRVVKFYLYNSEICNIEGNISMIALKKIEILLRDLDIKRIGLFESIKKEA